MAKDPNSSGALSQAFGEVNSNTPKVVSSTLAKYGPDRARKQKIAIALSKAKKGISKFPAKLRSTNSKAY